MFVFYLFVCPEFIERLAGATDLKFSMRVEHVVTRNKTKDKKKLFSEKVTKYLGLSNLRLSIKLCGLSIGAVTSN